jgi:hypothetical protein
MVAVSNRDPSDQVPASGSGSTTAVSPSTPTTWTGVPRGSACESEERAVHSSPAAKTEPSGLRAHDADRAGRQARADGRRLGRHPAVRIAVTAMSATNTAVVAVGRRAAERDADERRRQVARLRSARTRRGKSTRSADPEQAVARHGELEHEQHDREAMSSRPPRGGRLPNPTNARMIMSAPRMPSNSVLQLEQQAGEPDRE